MENVLGYQFIPAGNRAKARAKIHSKVSRQYRKWREEQGMSLQCCDMKDCVFHTQPMEWRGQKIAPILDHINGNSMDNNTNNLRYLCPNCDSQLQTRGGGNRGRILEASEDRYIVRLDRKGLLRGILLRVGTGRFALTGYSAALGAKSEESSWRSASGDEPSA